MVSHNKMLPNVHLGKDWQEKVRTWFNQPGRKHRRQMKRKAKANLNAPNPTHTLKPIVRGQTNKYNTKSRLGRGFTVKELKEAGINGIQYARSLGISIDTRRKDTSDETLKKNAQRIKEYISRMILFPRDPKKPSKGKGVKEATAQQMESPEAKIQNTCKYVIEKPKEEDGYSFAPITKEMKDTKVYQTLRKELKTAKGFYKRLEEAKKKAQKK